MPQKNWLKGEQAESLKQIVEASTGATVEVLDTAATRMEWTRCRESHGAHPRVVEREDALFMFLYKPRVQHVTHGLKVSFPSAPMDKDIQFCHCLFATFEEDVESARHGVPWGTLTASRIPRTIALYAPLATSKVADWLELVESSMTLTYEGKPVRYTALFLDGSKELEANSSSLFVRFAEPMDLENALLHQTRVSPFCQQ